MTHYFQTFNYACIGMILIHSAEFFNRIIIFPITNNSNKLWFNFLRQFKFRFLLDWKIIDLNLNQGHDIFNIFYSFFLRLWNPFLSHAIQIRSGFLFFSVFNGKAIISLTLKSEGLRGGPRLLGWLMISLLSQG